MGGADGRAAHRRDPGSRERRRRRSIRRGTTRGDRPSRRAVAADASCDLGPSPPWPRGTPTFDSSSCWPRRGSARRAATRSSPLVDGRRVAMPDRHGRRQFRIERDASARRPTLGRWHHAGRRVPARQGHGVGRPDSSCSATPPTPACADVAYRAVRNEDCWGATPGAGRYNHLVEPPELPRAGRRMAAPVRRRVLIRGGDRRQPRSGVGRRSRRDAVRRGDLPASSLYTAGDQPNRRAAACRSPRPTSWTFLRLLDPALDTQFAIGPTDYLRSNARTSASPGAQIDHARRCRQSGDG